MLVLLKDFMHQTHVQINDGSDGEQSVQPGDDPRPKPCDYFDLIGGTGTGGLIAIMLGRLRMDIPSCVDTYVEMTRRVFETDKTIAGIPYRSTMFKASKLEDAIRQCVARYEPAGDHESAIGSMSIPSTPRPGSMYSDINGIPRRSTSTRTWRSSSVISPMVPDRPAIPAGIGDSNAYLYDSRPNRTKTYVQTTVVFSLKKTYLGLVPSPPFTKEPKAKTARLRFYAHIGRAKNLRPSSNVRSGRLAVQPAPQNLHSSQFNWDNRFFSMKGTV